MTNAEREQLRELLIATVELAIVRHDISLNDGLTRREIAEDAANAVQGIDCCDEEPIPEWTALLTALDSAEKREKVIICEACDGLGFREADGQQHSCRVCDGDPRIDFALVAEYAKQIDDWSRRARTAESALSAERERVIAMEAALRNFYEWSERKGNHAGDCGFPEKGKLCACGLWEVESAAERALRSPEVAPKERK